MPACSGPGVLVYSCVMLADGRAHRVLGSLVVVAVSCSDPSVDAARELPRAPLRAAADALQPLPAALGGDPLRVALGRDLFFEPALSRDRSLTCASCHPFAQGGADPRPRALGIDGKATAFNVPSVFNLAYDAAYNWNGRIRDLRSHAELPLARLMGMSGDAVVAALAAEADYGARFAAAYPDGLTLANVADALASYEWTLVTPNAPLDRYLLGQTDALGPDERAGYELFRAIGCVSCHQGINVGGNLFQRFGVFRDPHPAGEWTEADMGRYAVTKREEDRGVFRVPSLRNVALTAPYFHDGSVAELREAVQIMGMVQLGIVLGDDQVAHLVAFLGALTGAPPEAPRG